MGSVFVPGAPAPQGSKRHVGGGKMVEASKAVGPWRERVALAASAARHGDLERGPVALSLTFFLPRPAGHFGTGRNAGTLRGSAPSVPATRPDLDKLLRAVLDALTGIVYADDSQVARVRVCKLYAEREPGVAVAWERLALPATKGTTA